MIKFSPSILAADILAIGQETRKMERAGADWLHVDVMDGHFVPNLTFGPHLVEGLAAHTSLPLDVHLMIEDPARYADIFLDAGAAGITFHVEAMENAEAARALLTHIRARGARAGLSIKPATSPEAIAPFADAVDMVLVMLVEPGFGGQKMIPQCVEKLPQVRALLNAAGRVHAHVQVDGGVTRENAMDIVCAGADVLVMGTGLFKADDPRAIISALRAQATACAR